jgi:HPt (histidine-containing phosphotransfer) domain-containing protein
MRDLLQVFVVKTHASLSKLSDAAAGDRWDQVASLAHELKGSAGNVAACRLSALAAEMESAVLTGQSKKCHLLCEQLALELAKCKQSIESFTVDSGSTDNSSGARNERDAKGVPLDRVRYFA